ncbi:hypothetical protein Pfo_011451, partial [Paulownia fortunei]
LNLITSNPNLPNTKPTFPRPYPPKKKEKKNRRPISIFHSVAEDYQPPPPFGCPYFSLPEHRWKSTSSSQSPERGCIHQQPPSAIAICHLCHSCRDCSGDPPQPRDHCTSGATNGKKLEQGAAHGRKTRCPRAALLFLYPFFFVCCCLAVLHGVGRW